MNFLKPLACAFCLILFACSHQDNATEKQTSTRTHELNLNQQTLLDLIQEKDSLLFDIGFNQLDTLQVAKLVSADFEFYHNEHGIIESKSSFIKSIIGIKELPFKTWRVLQEESMEVFPLYKENGQVLYGAIQNGIHEFYQQPEGKDARKSSRARFTHLWIIEDGEWKLKRVLSYNHHLPN